MAVLIIVARLLIDSGTEWISDKYVHTSTVLYEGRVLDWGHAERSISVPVSLPRVSDCRFRMADTDRRWRILLEQQTPRRRHIQLVRIHDEYSPAIERTIGTFEIVMATFPQDEVQIVGRDLTFAWLDKPVVQNLITRRNFPDLAEGIDEAFLAIIAGENRSVDANEQGVIRLPHMGMMSSIPETSPVTLVDRYGIAAHPISTANDPIIYRREPGDGLFSVVPDTEYTITQDLTARTIDGVDYFFTFLDFDVQQADGTEIRADIDGYFFRGLFENDDYSMPEVTNLSGPLRNPIDFLINVLYVIIKQDIELSRFDIESFDRVREIFEGEGSPVVDPYYCDGAIVQPMTARAFLQQFCTNFELDIFQNKNGKIEVNITTATDADLPLFDDTLHILKGSLTWTLANPTFNRWRYRYAKNFATNEYAGEGIVDNEDDQLALAVPDSSPLIPHIEEEIIEFPFVRHENTARLVIGRRADFLALGSYRVSFSLPMPEVYNDLELSHQFALTTVFGPGETGWINEAFKTTDIVHRFGARVTDVKGILRTPVEVFPAGEAPDEGDFTALVPIDLLFTEIIGDDFESAYESTGVYIDPDEYDGITGCYFECVLANAFDAVDVTLALVDEDGTEYATVTGGADGFERVRSTSFNLDTVPHYYMLKTLEPGAGFDEYSDTKEARILIKQVNASKTKIHIPLLTGDGSVPGFQGSEAANDKACWCAFAGATSYGPLCTGTGLTLIPGWHNKIKIEKSKYDPIDHCEFEIIANTNYFNTASVGSHFAALFNATTGLMIAGTEIEFTQDQPPENKRISFPPTATNFTEGDEVWLQVKASISGFQNQLWVSAAYLNYVLA